MTKKKNVVVFDMDETLGDFSQPYIFWNSLNKFLNIKTLDDKYFFSFIDLFPAFFRTNIFNILKYVKKKKIDGYCDYVMIYTNNNGPNYWADIIISYIHNKLNYKLFDRIIRSYKINGKIVEKNRTTYEKSYSDFLHVTELQSNTLVCFIDDQNHPYMKHDNVLYIQIQPYTYNIGYSEIISKYFKKNAELFKEFNKTKNDFINYMKILSEYNVKYLDKTKLEKNIDVLISNNIKNNIKKFINENSKYTRKYTKQIKNKTIKR